MQPIPTPALHPSQYPAKHLPSQLRIAFIHPDLGLGGAERLVVDAAVALQQRGHQVELFTSYHEDGKDGRSFPETRDGTLKVHVLGGWFFPRSFLGRFTIIFAILRQVHLVFSFLLATWLYNLSSLPLLSSFALPYEAPFQGSKDWSVRRQLEPFDVIVVDQLSAGIPLLRWYGLNRIVFYCHFPDQLLSPSSSSSSSLSTPHDPRAGSPFSFSSELSSLYRAPIDALEMSTTGEADKILVNSRFTQEVFEATFKELRRTPRVVYPAVDVKSLLVGNKGEATTEHGKVAEQDRWLVADQRPIVLSINRFEGKKDLSLALEAFAKFRSSSPSASTTLTEQVRLICAGGYDPRLGDNVRTLSNLQHLANRLGLSQYTYNAAAASATREEDVTKKSPVPARFRPTISNSPPDSESERPPDVLFLLNMSESQKRLFLSPSSSSNRVVALLYTPMYEHFGIVPLEAMAAGIPVLATETGGPTETIVDNGLLPPDLSEEDLAAFDGPQKETTGLLRPRDPAAWALALSQLVHLPASHRSLLARAGQTRVAEGFSLERLGEEMERACRDAAGLGYPIPYEAGYKKMCAFAVIAFVTLCFGVGAYWMGVRHERGL
ncbi:hypothetical protein JCM10908_004479 [Rhodotorula pacifica]|uniref:GDP-Man:Man(1)GlcNAc(2)-PP-dolichol alpha-1,3-mannosyltransferase n=1 Tax=Rhodotorula pacifica TaxID=1495444 RepID=UPI003182262A